MTLRTTVVLGLLLTGLSCVEPQALEDTTPPATLVVEGVFSDQLKQHQILLSRATSIASKKVVSEHGATVTISDETGTIISLSEDEEKPGRYLTPEMSANPERTYTLHITTTNGRRYESAAIP